MPIYEYRRPDGTTFEVMQRMSDDPLTHDRRRACRSSASSAPSPSTSRARASTTPTTGRRSATASKATREVLVRRQARRRDVRPTRRRRAARRTPRRRPRPPTARRPTAARRRARRRRARRVRDLVEGTSPTGSARRGRPAPPSGSVDDAVGREDVRRRRAAESPRGEERRAASGRSCRSERLRRVPGDPRQADEPGRRQHPRLHRARRCFCWRRARVRSFSRALQGFLRVRASASACLPSMCVLPGARRSV